jgi:hypothetical protein
MCVRAHTPADANSCGVAGLFPHGFAAARPADPRPLPWGNWETVVAERVSIRVAGCEGSSAAESSLRAACPCGFNPASRCSAAGFLPRDAAPPMMGGPRPRTTQQPVFKYSTAPVWTKQISNPMGPTPLWALGIDLEGSRLPTRSTGAKGAGAGGGGGYWNGAPLAHGARARARTAVEQRA